MKILILNYEYPPLGGGAGSITKHLAEEFAKNGHEITVLTTWYKGLDELSTTENLQIIRLKAKRRHIYRSGIVEMISWINMSKQFLKYYLKNHTFNLCFANFAIPGGVVGLFLKNKYGIPFTVISHGHDIPWYCPKEMFWYHLLLYPYIKHICLKSEVNFIQTTDMKANIDKFIGYDKAYKNVIIPNGCDTHLFSPTEHKSQKSFQIIFACRLVKQKDPFTFLKALVLLKNKNIPFYVKICGDGVLKERMQEFSKRNELDARIEYTGWLNREELASVYKMSHVFVQTSIHEAMSIAIMEAVASGAYIMCTDVGNNKELISPHLNGEIIPICSHNILADTLEKYYLDKFQNQYVIDNKIIESFKNQWAWSNIAQRYEGCFKEMIILKNKL